MNQLATPGLGSLIAGRRVAGAGQLLLALAGFVMVVIWFVQTAIQLYHQLGDGAEARPIAWVGKAGALVFLASWLWALITSISILREARANENK